jgi:hypothetical protein
MPDEAAHRVTVGNDGSIHDVDVDVTVCDFETIYHLAEEDVCDTGGLVGVRVLAQGKAVIFRVLVSKDIGNKAPSDVIRV